jgi:hypothetical protein
MFLLRRSMTSSESYIILAVVAGLALVALIYLLSPMSLLEDITTRGAEIRTRLRELLPDKYPATDTKTILLLAYVDIALEHHEAIWLLTERKLNGSAFALVRPVYDAMFRALWINKIATEQQIGRAIDDKLGFDINKVVEQIKEGYFSDRPPEERELSDKILQQLKDAWGPMCSYTHSGALAIRRRFTNDELKPNYDDAAIVEALNLATLALLLLLHMFFVSMKCPKEDAETQMLLRQYSVDFAHRVQGGQ